MYSRQYRWIQGVLMYRDHPLVNWKSATPDMYQKYIEQNYVKRDVVIAMLDELLIVHSDHTLGDEVIQQTIKKFMKL